MSTGAIINRLQANKDRQRALILGVFASVVAIMVFIVVLERPSNDPPAPSPVSEPQEQDGRRKIRPPQRSHATPPAAEATATPSPAAPFPAPPTSLRMHITCTHGWGLWVDQRKFGTCKTLDLDLTPGPHQVMARRGRHMLQETIQLDTAVAVRIDGARRKISVQKLQ